MSFIGDTKKKAIRNVKIIYIFMLVTTTPGSECALTSLAVDEPLEYARLYLNGNLQMWVDAEDSLEI